MKPSSPLHRYYPFVCWLLLAPAWGWGSQLTSVQSSYHASGNFAIVVLHFDGPFTYQLQEISGGQKVLLNITDCAASTELSRHLTAVKNTLVGHANLEASSEALTLSLQFIGPMKLRVSRTQSPYSLILDVTPVKKSSNKGGTVQTGKEKPPAKKPTVERVPARPPEHHWLAEAKDFLAQKQEREAIEALQKATQEDPDSTEAHYWLGLLLRKWGQPENAIEHFQKAKADSNFFLPALTELASLYHQLGLTAEEVAEWEAFFAALKRTHPELEPVTDDSLPEATPDLELIVGSPSEIPADHEPQKSPSSTSVPMALILFAVIVVLTTFVILLYLKQRELNRTITMLLRQDDDEAQSRRIKTAPVLSAEPPPTRADDSAESGAKRERPATEMARQVLSLYKAGMSIPAIAEKLSMGQDEVRLILNLVKEEPASA